MQFTAVMVRSELLVTLLGAFCGFVASADDPGTTQFQVDSVSNPNVNLNESKLYDAAVSPVSFNWLASIYFLSGTTGLSYKCVVTLLTPRMGLTAAHCFDSTRQLFFEGPSYVLLYNSNIRNLGDTATVQSIIRHPSYVQGSAPMNDLAVVVLTDRLNMRPTIALVDASSSRQRVGYMFGFGFVDKDDNVKRQEHLRIAMVNLVDSSVCNFNVPFSLTARCWRTTHGEKPCQGDSGASLIFYRNDGSQVLMGVHSYGSGTCSRDYGAVTDLHNPNLNRWVQDMINRNA